MKWESTLAQSFLNNLPVDELIKKLNIINHIIFYIVPVLSTTIIDV
jgi:hypothetical protein